ncbi:hypothetical protein COY52_10035 [Candidatus Desantisbacteria bacterium CG_4_10_14_0_8_um_filter_48_22]|uniref:Glycoside hydrolase family 38 N-terminal domain-containing protein n=1 Tax=Candidatus Desantisbacteria bacterium CG_4_10_14_0_8_um_filter_48_22 TaxID=1974543 RepID=A0A2M7S779_9BACT|nr:MAG: hypothetical protein AUJ67_07775 [Candidatus Desantisbacteria bacterium CG1_02_49_89]PIV56305.1 MAG: hypothetical protein COS16_04420 [Candidatus Desantisbacteria bacterium CG02_land_8_20_14_3_00_49_13]PIZ15330.1 MAG: hypothetical protein COY52_10035 [Candidatus Desantisbacteria bacterium CG_4_10_14_0_8_um_filter_48_22]
MIKKVFVVHHSHTDIGYTDIQAKIFRDHVKFLDQALEYCRETDGYPRDSQFRWTCETSWMAKNYLEHRPGKVREFIRRVKEGRVEITALYLNVTELYTAEELIRSIYFAKGLEKRYGIKIVSAMNSDVPGMSWVLPQVLAKAGIKYFSMSTNPIRSFRPEVPYPFYWVSPGGGKVLAWNTESKEPGSWYGRGYSLGLGESYEKVSGLLPGYLRKLEKEGCPYDAVCIRTAMDNAGPHIELSKIAREWNEKHGSPKIIVATNREYFEYMERKYGRRLPFYKLAWPDWWADGNASAARETGISRDTHRKLIDIEKAASFLSLFDEKYPKERIDRIWDNLMFFDEHTWGSRYSISKPRCFQSRSQWAVKSSFIRKARAESVKLLGSLSQKLSKKIKTSLKNKLYFAGNSMEGKFYRITLDPVTGGIKSLFDKELKRELVGQNSSCRFNQYIYEEIVSKEGRRAIYDDTAGCPGPKKRDAKFRRTSPGSCRITKGRNDTLACSLIAAIRARGCQSVRQEIILYGNEKRIDIVDTLSKKETLMPESIYYAFPFNFRNPEIKFEIAGAIMRPEKDQLPGTAKDYYSIQDWVSVSGGGCSAVWVSRDAPLVQFNRINTGKWITGRLKIKNGNIFSWVMNNYWYTNFRASQGGKTVFRYSITSFKGNAENSEAERFARSCLNPRDREFCSADKKNLTFLAFKRAEDENGIIIRMRETEGRDTAVNISFPCFDVQKACLCSIDEKEIESLPVRENSNKAACKEI